MPDRLTYIYHYSKRIAAAALYDFWKDECYTKSSLLTLYTLQSIVPFVALVLGIARGFGLDTYLLKLVTTLFEEQKEVIDYTVKFSYSMLQHLEGQVVAGIGVIFLLWTVLTLLNYIETVLNEIWKVRTPRSFVRKFSDYLALLVICPIIFVASSSITLYINSQVTNYETLADSTLIKNAGSYLQVIIKFVSPLLLSWLVFICIYLFVPNTRLSIWPRVLAAVLAGSLFQLWQILYLQAQIYVFSYNVVYGAVAALPLFLIWLQVSWLIILFGAELASHMEYDVGEEGRGLEAGKGEKIGKRQLGLLIVSQCLRTFYACEKPLSIMQMAHLLKIPYVVSQKMVEMLVDGGILAPIRLPDGHVGYHPLYDPEALTVKQVCDVIEKESDFETIASPVEPLEQISSILQGLDMVQNNAAANVNLSVLVTGREHDQ